LLHVLEGLARPLQVEVEVGDDLVHFRFRGIERTQATVSATPGPNKSGSLNHRALFFLSRYCRFSGIKRL